MWTSCQVWNIFYFYFKMLQKGNVEKNPLVEIKNVENRKCLTFLLWLKTGTKFCDKCLKGKPESK